jgi:hypothetical protein
MRRALAGPMQQPPGIIGGAVCYECLMAGLFIRIAAAISVSN